jgi:immune inhibitor A
MFHDWVDVEFIEETTTDVQLRPASEGGGVVVIQNKNLMNYKQYIIAEYRRRSGNDAFLPDEGVAIYVVDESIDNVNDESALAIELVQADGNRDLSRIRFGNQGDGGDLFPHRSQDGKIIRTIGKQTTPGIRLPNGVWPGVTISVRGNIGDPLMKIDVKIA